MTLIKLPPQVTRFIFVKNIPYHYKKYFEQIVISCNHDEFKKIRFAYNQKMKNNSLNKKMNVLKRKFSEVKNVAQ